MLLKQQESIQMSYYYFIKNNLKGPFIVSVQMTRYRLQQLGIAGSLVLGYNKILLLHPDCFQRLHNTNTLALFRGARKLSKQKLHLFDICAYKVYSGRCTMQHSLCLLKLQPTLQKELKLRINSSLPPELLLRNWY